MLLEEFPNFSNIRATIKVIRLTNNKIREVQFIPKLPCLVTYDLSGNDLTQIPNLSNVSTSLKKLYISRNDSIKVGNLPQLATLELINLNYNSLIDEYGRIFVSVVY